MGLMPIHIGALQGLSLSGAIIGPHPATHRVGVEVRGNDERT